MSNPHPNLRGGLAHEEDVMWRLECELALARRSCGALRAWQSTVDCDSLNAPRTVEINRLDLSNMIEVIHCELSDRLDVLEDLVGVLQGFDRAATAAVGKARGR